jgi:hypothetical protein
MDPRFLSDRRNRIGGMCVQGTQEDMKRRVENVRGMIFGKKRMRKKGHKLDGEEASDKPCRGCGRQRDL